MHKQTTLYFVIVVAATVTILYIWNSLLSVSKLKFGCQKPPDRRFQFLSSCIEIYEYFNGRIILFGKPVHQLWEKSDITPSPQKSADLLQTRVNFREADCSHFSRIGHSEDGGWDYCLVGPFFPKINHCLVLSFGINNDFSFDDSIATRFNCTVHSFDPTMKVKDHNRSQLVHFHKIGLYGENKDHLYNVGTVKTLSELLIMLNYSVNIEIDFLKIDIEYSEYSALQQILFEKSFFHVKQLAFELHTFNNDDVSQVQLAHVILDGLYASGFRLWMFNWNNYCLYVSQDTHPRTSCNELYFININYLHQGSRRNDLETLFNDGDNNCSL